MSTAPRPNRLATPLSGEGLLAYARIICGQRCHYSECFEPAVERDIRQLFCRLASRLEAMTRKPTFSKEFAAEYHRARGKRILITDNWSVLR
jgi:hypothetical protein